MIGDAIIIALYYVIYYILTPIRLLSDVTLDSNISSAITSASNYIKNVDAIVPISTVVAIIGVYLSIELAIFVYKLIMWLIKKIPTIN